MASQRPPGRLTIATPRLAGIVLSLIVLLIILVVLALFLDNDNDEAEVPARPAEAITAADAWVRVVPSGTDDEAEMADDSTPAAGMEDSGVNAGAFLTLRNAGDDDRRLVGVTVAEEVARVAELHETTLDENDVMRMRPLDWIEIPANGEVRLAPGGLHIMLIDVQPGVTAGSSVELTLIFDNDTSAVVAAEVRAAE